MKPWERSQGDFLCAELLVIHFHFNVKNLRIAQCCLDPRMAEELLNLLDRHTALEGQGGGCVPEYVRRDFDG